MANLRATRRNTVTGLTITRVGRGVTTATYDLWRPSFRAVKFKSGTVTWSEDRFRAGSVLLAGDKLLIIREAGEMIPFGQRDAVCERLLWENRPVSLFPLLVF
jgi:hypothetical protein